MKIPILLACLLVVPACATDAPTVASDEAAICVSDSDPGTAFTSYNAQTGGLAGAGFPRSGLFWARSTDGNSYWTQCFERRVLEYHAGNDCAWKVEGRQLGADRLAALYHGSTPPLAHAEGASRFSGKPNVRDDFYAHWLATGNGDFGTALSVTGYPISDYFTEQSEREPGRTYLVQYFERGVFELHPEVSDPQWRVMGKLLGVFAPMCAAGNLSGPKLDIAMAAFIPGPKPGTPGPGCDRVNFANLVGGLSGGIFNTDQRDFDFASVMSRSKVAGELTLTANGVDAGSFQRHATVSCRYDDDAGVPYPDTDWCRQASGSAPVTCQQASSDGITIEDAHGLGTNADGRIGQHVKLHLNGANPLMVYAPPIDGWCEIDAYFDGTTLEPVDMWAHCSHKAFPSYELYLGGVQVMTHSAFGHAPWDLQVPSLAIDTRHHCSKSGPDWACTLEQ